MLLTSVLFFATICIICQRSVRSGVGAARTAMKGVEKKKKPHRSAALFRQNAAQPSACDTPSQAHAEAVYT